MVGAEEEFWNFVEKNKDLIKKIMVLQKEGVIDIVSVGREAVHEAVVSADATKQKTEDFAKAACFMFMDPEVQRHFMAMGMELFMGLSAMIQKAPIPNFVKETAGSTERTWKSSVCKTNDECGAKSQRMQRVKVNVEQSESEPRRFTEIKINDQHETE